jgi:hypothetical protein
MNVNVLLSGRLRLNGYGKGRPENRDRTYQLSLPAGSTVREVIGGMQVPPSEVTMTMLNGCQCDVTTHVRSGDRIVLIPSDVALLWRHVGKMNGNGESVLDS